MSGGETPPPPTRRSNSTDLEDDEADYFAMCLLMPERFVRAEIEKMGGLDPTDDKAVSALAKRFEVGPALMARRLAQIEVRARGGLVRRASRTP